MDRRSWLIVLLLVPVAGFAALVVWWWLRWREEEARYASRVRFIVTGAGGAGARPKGPSGQEEYAPREKLHADLSPDDLKAIEGIGPKISSVLSAAGITTFAQLAAADVAQLRRVLVDAGVRLAYPDTWPEQAALAAAADWDGLRDLQSQLDRGRRRSDRA